MYWWTFPGAAPPQRGSTCWWSGSWSWRSAHHSPFLWQTWARECFGRISTRLYPCSGPERVVLSRREVMLPTKSRRLCRSFLQVSVKKSRWNLENITQRYNLSTRAKSRIPLHSNDYRQNYVPRVEKVACKKDPVPLRLRLSKLTLYSLLCFK